MARTGNQCIYDGIIVMKSMMNVLYDDGMLHCGRVTKWKWSSLHIAVILSMYIQTYRTYVAVLRFYVLELL